MTFGCVASEDKAFQTQKADGVMGLSKQPAYSYFKSIVDQMKDQNMIDVRVFSICMGQNGGYFQIGGYDGQNHTTPNITWTRTYKYEYDDYQLTLAGMAINGDMVAKSVGYPEAVIDSMTTFTKLPSTLFYSL